MTHDDRKQGPNPEAGKAPSEADLDRELEVLFERISVEKAPASLSRRLRRIPAEQQPRESWWKRLLAPAPGPRWALVPALAVSLLVIGVVLFMPRQPSQADVLQARQDLALAFHYIEEAGLVTSQEIQTVLDDGLRHPVKDSLSEHMPFTKQFRKEETS
jgi:anti-sigma factor RsiW